MFWSGLREACGCGEERGCDCGCCGGADGGWPDGHVCVSPCCLRKGIVSCAGDQLCWEWGAKAVLLHPLHQPLAGPPPRAGEEFGWVDERPLRR